MKIVKDYHSSYLPETVYNAWISENMVFPPITRIEIQPKLNGNFLLYSGSGEDKGIMKGKILEIVPHHKIRYSWHWDGSNETTEVTVEFVKSENGSTIKLTHQGFLTKPSLERHASGWDFYVSSLEDRLDV